MWARSWCACFCDTHVRSLWQSHRGNSPEKRWLRFFLVFRILKERVGFVSARLSRRNSPSVRKLFSLHCRMGAPRNLLARSYEPARALLISAPTFESRTRKYTRNFTATIIPCPSYLEKRFM